MALGDCFLKWEYNGPIFPISGPPGESPEIESGGVTDTTPTAATTMSSFHPGESSSHPYHEPAPLPSSIPKVNEVGATSAPLKSAAFFIGAYCKEFNGGCGTYSCSKLTQCVSYRGLYALQGGKPRACSLPEGGSTGNSMCN